MHSNQINYSFNIKCIIIYVINPIFKNYYHFTFKFFYIYPFNLILNVFILKYKFIQKILKYKKKMMKL